MSALEQKREEEEGENHGFTLGSTSE